MNEVLYWVETDRVALTLSGPPRPTTGWVAGRDPGPGRWILEGLRPGQEFRRRGWRAEPAGARPAPAPRLYEGSRYRLEVEALPGSQVQLEAGAPGLLAAVAPGRDPGRAAGELDLRGRVGRRRLVVLVDGEPELSLEFEVFPTRLDYRRDYQRLLDEVQEWLTALALDYLREAYRAGGTTPTTGTGPAAVEWWTLLREVAADLERALHQVAAHPTAGLRRRRVMRRVDRIQRVDAALRAQVRRGKGAGARLRPDRGPPLRACLLETRALTTLDTPEHRWIAARLEGVRRRLRALRSAALEGEAPERRAHLSAELSDLELRVRRLQGLGPLRAAQGAPPPGFASLQLVSAPGYRAAYRALMVLSLGLRLHGGPLDLPLQEVGPLYETWSYLALLRLLADETGRPLSTRELFEVRDLGLRVRLRPGASVPVRIEGARGRVIEACWEPPAPAHLPPSLSPPRVLLTVKDPGWPAARWALDPGYTLDASEAYQEAHGAPGPPAEAVLRLHALRDAMLERGPGFEWLHGLEGAARLFPLPEEDAAALPWTPRLRDLGVGALPLLPGDTAALRAWLRRVLRAGGLRRAQRGPGQAGPLAAARARRWAGERAWFTPARAPRAEALAREGWTASVPVEKVAAALTARWLVRRGRDGGASHRLAITRARLGPASGAGLAVRYQLDDPRPLRTRLVPGAAVLDRGWTSRLAIERARTGAELSLDRLSDWSLVDELAARGLEVTALAEGGEPGLVIPDRGTLTRGAGGGWLAGSGDEVLRGPDAVLRWLDRDAPGRA